MKVRAIILVDMDVDGGFKEVAAEQEKLEAIINGFADTNSSVVATTMDVKERRGAGPPPDLTKMKLKVAK